MVRNLSETTLGMSGKLRRISNRKRNHLFFDSTCLRVLFCARRLYVVFTQVFEICLSNRLNIVKFIPKKVRGTA